MNTIPVTIRIPKEQLELIDAYANEHHCSRNKILKECIILKSEEIKKEYINKRLLNASLKVRNNYLKEVHELEGTIKDSIDE